MCRDGLHAGELQSGQDQWLDAETTRSKQQAIGGGRNVVASVHVAASPAPRHAPLTANIPQGPRFNLKEQQK